VEPIFYYYCLAVGSLHIFLSLKLNLCARLFPVEFLDMRTVSTAFCIWQSSSVGNSELVNFTQTHEHIRYDIAV